MTTQQIPTQREMAFAESARRRAIRETLEQRASSIDDELKRIVDHFGAKEVADRLGLEDETIIYHWLGRRGGRRPPMDLVDVCLDLDDTERLMAAICRDRHEIPRRLEIEDEKRLAQNLKAELRKLGELGEQILARARRAVPEASR